MIMPRRGVSIPVCTSFSRKSQDVKYVRLTDLNVAFGDDGNPSPIGKLKYCEKWSRERVPSRCIHEARSYGPPGMDTLVS